MPPSIPLPSRRTSQTSPSRSIQKAQPRRNGFGFFGAFTGKRAGSPVERALHAFASGHSRHLGSRAVQTEDPRSIIACAKSPARRAGVMASAAMRMGLRAAGIGVSIANSRATTRSTLASTTTARWAKAIAATAAAV